MVDNSFTDGETPEPSAKAPLDLSKVDPKKIAQLVLKHRSTSVKAEIASGVALTEGYDNCKSDDRLGELLSALRDAKVLSSEETEKALGNKSTISKWRKIAEHMDTILHPRVLRLIRPGYSVLYQLALLIEEIGNKQ